MSYVMEFHNVSTAGLESSRVASRSLVCERTRPATSTTSTTTSSPWSRRARRTRLNTRISERSGSSSPMGWRSQRSSPRSSSLRGRSPGWPEPFAVPTSPSRRSTGPRTCSAAAPAAPRRPPGRAATPHDDHHHHRARGDAAAADPPATSADAAESLCDAGGAGRTQRR